ncbi:hypothetical protein ACFY3G_19020 [Streptomyces phaeochromogenes]|uniref:hypothetical protein n=1 Tax=Streptomyces phaeochromogenes TaxID=1923 RepID=UPI0036CC9180
MPHTPRPNDTQPIVDVRLGGLRLTIQRLPYPLLALLSGIATSVGTSIWFSR